MPCEEKKCQSRAKPFTTCSMRRLSLAQCGALFFAACMQSALSAKGLLYCNPQRPQPGTPALVYLFMCVPSPRMMSMVISVLLLMSLTRRPLLTTWTALLRSCCCEPHLASANACCAVYPLVSARHVSYHTCRPVCLLP